MSSVSNSSSGSSDSGLSTGDIVGIAGGGTVLVAGLTGLYWKKRAERKAMEYIEYPIERNSAFMQNTRAAFENLASKNDRYNIDCLAVDTPMCDDRYKVAWGVTLCAAKSRNPVQKEECKRIIDDGELYSQSTYDKSKDFFNRELYPDEETALKAFKTNSQTEATEFLNNNGDYIANSFDVAKAELPEFKQFLSEVVKKFNGIQRGFAKVAEYKEGYLGEGLLTKSSLEEQQQAIVDSLKNTQFAGTIKGLYSESADLNMFQTVPEEVSKIIRFNATVNAATANIEAAQNMRDAVAAAFEDVEEKDAFGELVSKLL